ncbi:MAG TPA: glycosyltransferase family A protein, partial [Longimicrobium sp.]|nr:glycosyltransferase family A protein [Longimicrobium sp.]
MQENHVPKVSIGMPVYNGEPLVRQALESVLSQSFADFELIISDNGSTDGSTELLRGVAASDPRVRYFRQEPPIRAYDNFRFVLEQARGEYFMWAAHDDTRDPDFVAKLVAALQDNREAVLAFGDLNVVTPDNPQGTIKPFDFATDGLGRLERLRRGSRMQCYHIYGLWRTEAVRQVPYAYCSWWPDLPMMLAAAVLGSFVHVPDTRFHYLEMPKTALERVQVQDFTARINLPLAVASHVRAVFRACAQVGGGAIGAYGAGLAILKQANALPAFI